MKKLTLDNILLTQEVVKEYFEFVDGVARELKKRGVKPWQIPNEQVREDGKGGLEIFVVLDDENSTKISFNVPPDGWSWM